MIVDLFAGPGGWSQAVRSLGMDEVGIEWDKAAVLTREAAGHRSIRGDVSQIDPGDFNGVQGLIASPPCPAFSAAGKKEGLADMDALHAHALQCRDGWTIPEAEWTHEESRLVTEVLRWVAGTDPEWVACEQLPAVLPIWKAYAHVLRAWGYSAWAGLLNAADYGVPQTRRRAILMAHRTRSVGPPQPTHSKDGGDNLFGLRPWVSMAEALGWGAVCLNANATRGEGMIERHGDRREREADEVGPTVTTHARDWEVRGGNQDNATERAGDKPAPTLPGNSRLWNHLTTEERDAMVEDGTWPEARPATTIMGDSRVFPPNGHHEPGKQSRHSRRLTIEEAAVLQTFPPDYPFQGSRTKQFEQVGNAVPPMLAEAILRALIGEQTRSDP